MFDINKCEKMYVKDSEDRAWRKLFVVGIYPNGKCLTVRSEHEADFCDENFLGHIKLDRYDQYKPIPKTKTIPMTNEEVLKIVIDNPGIWVRVFKTSSWQKIQSFSNLREESVRILIFRVNDIWYKLISLEYTLNPLDKTATKPFTKEIEE